MKRKRKQIVIMGGKRWLVDVPEDDILYRLDCRAEYLRSRSLRFETSLDDISSYIGSPLEAQPEYIVEREDLRRRLADARSRLSGEERRLLYWRFARLMNCSQQKVSRELQRILSHLRRELQL